MFILVVRVAAFSAHIEGIGEHLVDTSAQLPTVRLVVVIVANAGHRREALALLVASVANFSVEERRRRDVDACTKGESPFLERFALGETAAFESLVLVRSVPEGDLRPEDEASEVKVDTSC